MKIYGIRELRNGVQTPLSVLAQVCVMSDAGDALSDRANIDIEAAITLTTGRKTLFLSHDLDFVSELFMNGKAWDFREYFEFQRVQIPGVEYEIYEVINGDAVQPTFGFSC